MSFLEAEPKEPKSGAGKFVFLAVVVLVTLGGIAYWFLGQAPEPAPVETEAPPPVVEESPPEPEPEPEAAPAPDLPSTGSLSVRANVEGAAVFLDGERVGEVPFERDDQPIGSFEVRVEKEGYRPYVEQLRVRPGRSAELIASLRPLPASLHVVSDVPGATVFLDRNYAGTTPVTIEDVEPGEHQLTVSAEGFDMYAETVSVGETGRRDIQVSFKSVDLSESIDVVHKHTFGDCKGRLIADNQGIRYETPDNDAFQVGYGNLERFEIDYMDKNLNLKIRGGKNYNFTEQSGNADALFLFHKNVQEFMERS